MTQKNDPNLSLAYGWDYGENGWNSGYNTSMKRLGALMMLHVESMSLTAPPVSPSNGDRYVPAATATGDFAGHENDVAVYIENAWEFHTPQQGWSLYCHDCQQIMVFNGTAWIYESQLYQQYANAAAAASGGVPTGGLFINSSTGALTVVV